MGQEHSLTNYFFSALMTFYDGEIFQMSGTIALTFLAYPPWQYLVGVMMDVSSLLPWLPLFLEAAVLSTP